MSESSSDLVRFVKGVINVFIVVAIIITILVIVVAVVSGFSGKSLGILPSMIMVSLPDQILHSDQDHSEISAGEINAEDQSDYLKLRLYACTGYLSGGATNRWISFWSAISILIMLVLVIYQAFLMRRVLQTVLDGDPFAVVNAHRISIIGFVNIIIGIACPVMNYILSCSALEVFDVAGADLSSNFQLMEYSEMVWNGLLILILALVFRHGARLQRERSLTI